MNGWLVEDDHVRLRDDSHVHILSQLLESFSGQTDVSQPKVLSLSSKLTKHLVDEYETIVSAVLSATFQRYKIS